MQNADLTSLKICTVRREGGDTERERTVGENRRASSMTRGNQHEQISLYETAIHRGPHQFGKTCLGYTHARARARDPHS